MVAVVLHVCVGEHSVDSVLVLSPHVQVRYQMLDSTPQKDRAALSQSKGLKDRRLPSHVASLVGDDRPPPRSVLCTFVIVMSLSYSVYTCYTYIVHVYTMKNDKYTYV